MKGASVSNRSWLTTAGLLGVLVLAACSTLPGNQLSAQQTEAVRHITILYTNDEHGWMKPYQNTGGSAGVAYKWRQNEGLTEDDRFLVLSGGDMWTGHALSTIWEGESMTDVRA